MSHILPDDLWKEIFRYLNPSDLDRTRLVCSRFLNLTDQEIVLKSVYQRAVETPEKLFNKLHMSFPQKLRLKLVHPPKLNYLKTLCHRVASVQNIEFKLDATQKITLGQMDTLIKHLPPLTKIHFTGALGEQLKSPAKFSVKKMIKDPNTKFWDLLICLSLKSSKEHYLSLAARIGSLTSIMLLIDLKVDMNTKDKLGLSPLWYAAWKGYGRISEILIHAGADPNVSSPEGASALWISYYYGHTSVVRALLTNNARICQQEKDEFLRTASQRGYAEIANILIQKGANINARDHKGRTALWLACRYRYKQVVEILLCHKADPNLGTYKGVTPLWLTLQLGPKKIAERLKKAGGMIYPHEDKIIRPIKSLEDIHS